jgi:tellurite resistance protein
MDAKRGCEEQFFHRQERDRRTARERAERSAAELKRLAEALGLGDESGAAAPFTLGITAETAPAFEALPLVEVAWADGGVGEEERWRLLEAATRLGVEFGRPAHALLESWLVRRPDPELFEAWHEWARVDPAQARLLLEAAERVAGAGGGLLGFGTVSGAERRAIDGIHLSLARARERSG